MSETVTATASNTQYDDFRNGMVRLRVGDVEVVMAEEDIKDPTKINAALHDALTPTP